MKKLILLLMGFILLLSGCVTQERCLEKFPPQEFVRDSIVYKTKVEYKDTTIYKELPADTQRVEVPITVRVPIHDSVFVNIPINVDTSFVETDYAMAFGWINNSRLGLEIMNKPKAFEFNLQNKLTDRYKEHNKHEKEVIEVEVIPLFYKICTIGFLLVCIVIVIYWYLRAKIIKKPFL